jgi:hypothetical protein
MVCFLGLFLKGWRNLTRTTRTDCFDILELHLNFLFVRGKQERSTGENANLSLFSLPFVWFVGFVRVVRG